MKIGRDAIKVRYMAGFTLPTSARNATKASSYLIYANVFGPLVDEGWMIVPVEGEAGANLVPTSKPEEAEQEGLASKRLRKR